MIFFAFPVSCNLNVRCSVSKPIPVNVCKPVRICSMSNHTSPLKKLNKVKPPKWEKCDYVHVPSSPVPMSCPATPPVKRPVKRPVKCPVKRRVTHSSTRPKAQPIPESYPNNENDDKYTQHFSLYFFLFHILHVFSHITLKAINIYFKICFFILSNLLCLIFNTIFLFSYIIFLFFKYFYKYFLIACIIYIFIIPLLATPSVNIMTHKNDSHCIKNDFASLNVNVDDNYSFNYYENTYINKTDYFCLHCHDHHEEDFMILFYIFNGNILAWNDTVFYQHSLPNTFQTNLINKHSPEVNKGGRDNKGRYHLYLILINFLLIFKLKNKPFFSLFYCMILFYGIPSPLSIVNSVDERLFSCVKNEFFTIESINVSNDFTKLYLSNSFNFYTLSKLKYKNHHLFLNNLLLLSGDISLNPGPAQIRSQLNPEQFSPFKTRGLHFLHLNINSLIPKIDELRYIVKLSKVTVIGISETKLDDSVLNDEISIDRI